MAPSPNWYDVLGAERGASLEDLRRAYRSRVKSAHPDRPGGSDDAFRIVRQAWEILGDPERRRNFDEDLSRGEQVEALRRQAEQRRAEEREHARRAAFEQAALRRLQALLPRGEDVRRTITVQPHQLAGGFVVAHPYLTGWSGRVDRYGDATFEGQGFASSAGGLPGDYVVRVLREPERGADRHEDVVLTLRQQRVRYPVGLRVHTLSEQQTLWFSGAGESGRYGGSCGDLYVNVSKTGPLAVVQGASALMKRCASFILMVLLVLTGSAAVSVVVLGLFVLLLS